VSFREQVLMMMNFRKGIVNVLFATSVAEEGLDIPDCNLVIRFDLYTTLIQYIQSRGRARHANSRYIHMCEDGNQDHNQIIMEVRRNEGILKRFCSALPEDRKLTGNDFNMDHFLAKERSHRVHIVKSTGAKLTYKMSLLILANFVDSLPHPQESNLQPEYVVTSQNKQFICEAILPESSPVRGAVGRPASTKQVAKCSAAFETCLLLRAGKYLDEWLLPTFTKQLPAMRNALLAVDSKKRAAYDMKTKPKLWSIGGVPEELFLTVLGLESPECLGRASQPLALLTRSRLPDLPSFMLHFGAGKYSPVQCRSLSAPMAVSRPILDQINAFTLCVFDDVFSKEYEDDTSKMPYFLVPISAQVKIDQYAEAADLVDWGVLKSIQDHQSKWADNPWKNKSWKTMPDEFLEDKFIVDPFDGARKLWSAGVTHEHKPLDPVPPNTAPRTGTRKNNDNIMEYSCSLWARARARRTFDENQRVVEASLISLRRNLLDEFDGGEDESPKRCFIILEPLKISPVSSKLSRMSSKY
jgi:endoribonuclease Dicer